MPRKKQKAKSESLPENFIYEHWVVKPRKAGPPEILGPLHCLEYAESVLTWALSEEPRSSLIMGGYIGTEEQFERCCERYAAQKDALKTSKALVTSGAVRPDDFEVTKATVLRNLAWNTAEEAGIDI